MYYNKDDFSIYYEKYGKSSKTILILPGWGDTRKTFSFLIDYLKNKFLIIPDLEIVFFLKKI